MRTLHFSLRVTDPERSLAFYTAVGYEVVGSVPDTPLGRLTMLKLPGDEFVSIELVHDPAGRQAGRHAGRDEADADSGLSHFVIKVESMDATLAELTARGVDAEAPVSPDGSDDFRTAWLTDPDGNRIELVQWPAGHPDGLSAADWQD
ncbi:VOC family protein [Streptomyces cyaneochromogenes]|uniref:VOC family protein n=2 Tax=Streptomyces TaxID=1883 RepID=A0A3Q9EM78_9ACTN|nr:VOC family protein [Streptomyces cyaneochromogenes]AZQ33919.1 VOC family protein [Streptomyces cyaneochromogenes]